MPVKAQVLPVLSVEPSTIEVPQGNRVQLELEVSDGADVNAFDIMINYDREGLSLLSWEHGDYLSNLSCTHLIRQPGVFELACNQLAQPEVDGDGVLLILIFDTLGIGFPDVTITEAAFIDSQGDITYPERQHGLVEVTSDPTFTPTPTITFTPTATYTPTAGFSPTPSSEVIVTPTITPTLSPTAGTFIPQTATLAGTERPYPNDGTAIPTNTEAAYPVGETTEVVETQVLDGTPPPDETSAPTDETDDQEFGSTEPGEPSRAKVLVRGIWETVLWGTLILGSLVIIGTGIFYFLRRKTRGVDEDLLL